MSDDTVTERLARLEVMVEHVNQTTLRLEKKLDQHLQEHIACGPGQGNNGVVIVPPKTLIAAAVMLASVVAGLVAGLIQGFIG